MCDHTVSDHEMSLLTTIDGAQWIAVRRGVGFIGSAMDQNGFQLGPPRTRVQRASDSYVATF